MNDWELARCCVDSWNRKLGRTPKILVIEDESDIAMVLEMLIKKAGAAVIVAKDVNTALLHLRDDHFDMAWVNLRLPRNVNESPATAGGIAVLKWCRENRPSLQTPIITGFDEGSPEVREARKSINPFPPVFQKPFDIHGVVSLLRQSGLSVNIEMDQPIEGETRNAKL